MRRLDKYFQIIEVDKPGHRTVIAGGKTKEIAMQALRMMEEYDQYNVDWYDPYIPHNMTNTEVTQGIVRKV